MLMKKYQDSYQKGFTLIELIVVILIIGILSGVLFTILRGPMTQFVQVEQRAKLVDIAETALLRMTREIRLALPNSVRISDGGAISSCDISVNTTCALEFLRTLDGGRYRSKGSNRLKFNKQSDSFEYFGTLNNLGSIDVGGTGQADCYAANATVDCMVVYNTGQTGANAYNRDNIAAVTGATVGPPTQLSFNLSPVTKFPNISPRQRFHVVDTPVSFVCSGSQISRYFDHLIETTQQAPPVSGSSNLLVNNISACTMDYDPGTSSRAGLVRLSITVRDNDLGQEVTLLQQAHVDNQP
jgi:MSHA biogenesis protein MshO